MKKFILIFFLVLIHNNAFSKNIVYLDVQYIIDNSELGKSYKSKINKLREKNIANLKIKEDEINTKKKKIDNQKKIINKEEMKKKIDEFNVLLNNFKTEKKTINKKIIDEKKKYTSKILNLLNPLLTKYVDNNNIKLVVEKKNIIVGIKSLDITNDILKILKKETKNNNLLNDN